MVPVVVVILWSSFNKDPCRQCIFYPVINSKRVSGEHKLKTKACPEMRFFRAIEQNPQNKSLNVCSNVVSIRPWSNYSNIYQKKEKQQWKSQRSQNKPRGTISWHNVFFSQNKLDTTWNQPFLVPFLGQDKNNSRKWQWHRATLSNINKTK